MGDRRTEYTKTMIRKALFTLNKKRSLSDITVKEICEEADINRATFYRNYLDIFDLYEKIEADICAEALKDGEVPGADRNRIFEIIYKNKHFYRDYFDMRLSSELLRITVKLLFDQMRELVKKRGTYNEAVFEMSYQFNYSGIAGAVKDWLNKGCVMEPKEFADTVYSFLAKQYR